MIDHTVRVVGAGLAGVEAAWTLASLGVPVQLHEMKPERFSPAHKSEDFAELVCSNSLGSMKAGTASALLKSELALLGSLVFEAALGSAVPAGGALAVERQGFGAKITKAIKNHEKISIVRAEVRSLPRGCPVIVASGPLTAEALAEEVRRLVGDKLMYFYDAIAPVIALDSIDMTELYWGARYQPHSKDYLNIPLTREQYLEMVNDLIEAEKVPLHDFEEPNYFESCLPIDVLAARGEKTLSFGPLKPVGLANPKSSQRPYAVVQLRRENYPTTMLSMVGCQNKLKYGEQKRIFRKLPGLAKADFVKLGSVHRNTYLHSPSLLNCDLSLRSDPNILFAGLLTGVEGYLESAAMGLLAAINLGCRLLGESIEPPPRCSMLGSLLHYISTPRQAGQPFQPINSNFALLPPLTDAAPTGRKGRAARRAMQSELALSAMQIWAAQLPLRRDGNSWTRWQDFQHRHQQDNDAKTPI